MANLGVKIQLCKDCEKLNKAIDVYDQFSWQSVGTICFNKDTQEILVNEDQLMRIIQLVNPLQKKRPIRLVNTEEMMEYLRGRQK